MELSKVCSRFHVTLGIELAMEFELRALETGADPFWSRERLVAHQKARAGHKGGLTTFARYGKPYMRALARVRWGKTPPGALPAIRHVLLRTGPQRNPGTPSPGQEKKNNKEERAA